MDKRTLIREKALADLQHSEVLMLNGHFDYGNGYHGRVYLNPHQLFRYPSTIWRLAQDLLDILPSELVERTEVVAGPVTGGALLAHTIAGLLDGRRALTHPPCSFAPFTYVDDGLVLREFYARQVAGRRVLLLADLGSGVLTLLTLSLLLAGELAIWHIYLIEAFTSIFDAFQRPAYIAATSTLLDKREYARASGMTWEASSLGVLEVL